MNALLDLRRKIAPGIITMVWINAALVAIAAILHEQSQALLDIGISLAMALLCLFFWRQDKTGSQTMMATAIANAVLVAMLVYEFRGSSLQIDMHMYFFAVLAISAMWIYLPAIIAFSLVVAIHHTAFYFVVPFAVFPGSSDFSRVILHAAILIFETAALAILIHILTSSTRKAEDLTLKAQEAQAASEALRMDNLKMQTQAAEERILTFETAEKDANAKLKQATLGLEQALTRLAKGELNFRLDEPFDQQFEGLRHHLNDTIQQFGHVLSSVVDTVVIIDDNSREIASGANDLSRRTESQAATLEETAASLDVLTSNIQQSTDNTLKAHAMANKATENAVQSSTVVTEAEDAMRRIEESSGKISSIISVIDEIAFQTNLLALNAGVEAARAGEAGKGFAVVAQEVRELAQRSAQAAREIKQLIAASSSEVDNGVRLVRNTGSTLQSISSNIQEIGILIGSIAASAKDQSSGLKDINSAVSQMDQTTQQNAAMVEQTTAASSAMASQAQQLKRMVEHFSLPRQTRKTQAAHLRLSA
ncbi:methyl-accepting chemotaxis protein [Agrobacterium vitis]|uniref:Methyl-accepting chemotaxis protein n=1 Tax=Agrobacterium vitis TaxID=373 RepID=A0AAE4W8T3_AGRVI|nr:methyl-accepting chemotaxis protein [Agrobacterium vitis]MCF1497867.1 methyl-accepting chemotaxis protein [Allorhizobium sp. Av2]MCM2438667.1 methyl-accepting chemotaxis protein [Agrobacterium vitis]MUZ56007.1 methyl-accepting chemotaxis protein [Agrobacterium vitis]MVA64855.1 methyl-accepting chemotaxis protein [Agrobacterium vitis]MVA85826.1 methyl-accepting chemotaxis protein [Agrobacterium vitis]